MTPMGFLLRRAVPPPKKPKPPRAPDVRTMTPRQREKFAERTLTPREIAGIDKESRKTVKEISPDDDYLSPVNPRYDPKVVRELKEDYRVGAEANLIAETTASSAGGRRDKWARLKNPQAGVSRTVKLKSGRKSSVKATLTLDEYHARETAAGPLLVSQPPLVPDLPEEQTDPSPNAIRFEPKPDWLISERVQERFPDGVTSTYWKLSRSAVWDLRDFWHPDENTLANLYIVDDDFKDYFEGGAVEIDDGGDLIWDWDHWDRDYATDRYDRMADQVDPRDQAAAERAPEQWEIEHADEIAEDIRREREQEEEQEALLLNEWRAEIATRQAAGDERFAPDPMCANPNGCTNPPFTKGRCKPCDGYWRDRKHPGEWRPARLINRATRRKQGF
jgi:hypothetical protein